MLPPQPLHHMQVSMWSEGREASGVLSARRAGVARLPCLWQSWRAAASATWMVTASRPCQTARAGWHLSWSRYGVDERCVLMLCVPKTSRTQAVLPGCAPDCVSAASLAPRNSCQGHRPLASHMQSHPHVPESCRVCAPVIARAHGGFCCPCSMTERWVMQPPRLAVVTVPQHWHGPSQVDKHKNAHSQGSHQAAAARQGSSGAATSWCPGALEGPG